MRRYFVIMMMVILAGGFPNAGTGFASISVQNGGMKMNNGWLYRKQLLLEYGALSTVKNEVSLRDVTSDADEASRAVAHVKTVLVLHLLQRMAGDEAYARLADARTVQEPVRSWDEIRGRFEKELGLDLGWFFKQWVDGTGLPELRVENAEVQRNASRFKISFDLVQKGAVYILDVPVVISFLNGNDKSELVKIDAEKTQIVLFVDDEPSRVVIDPGYDVPRRLTDAESPPLIAKLLSAEKLILVTAATSGDIYANAVAAWKERGAEVRTADTIKDTDVKVSSFLIFGPDNPLAERLYGTVEAGREELTVSAKKNPWALDRVVVIAQARTARAASGVLNAVLLHGICSTLTIDAKGRIAQQSLRSEQGIVMELRDEAVVVDISALRKMASVIDSVSRKKIVYVGEYHSQFAHHEIQLDIIKGLYQKDPKIAVGMEMFQRPFQKTLDDYITGSIDERAFLKKSEYFKRWGFDYNLYKPILDFARAEKVPVVALNLSREITDTVSKAGMDSLTDDMRKDVPAQMDFSDLEYSERLRQVFAQHEGSNERDFDFFLQSQILWDEGMARSIDEYLRRNPDRRMIVLAGGGHLAYGSGIPKRTFRRNGLSYATVLCDVSVDADIADFVVFPEALEGLTSPKIMAVLKEDGEQVSIAELPEESVSKKAGVKVGDIVVSIDDAPIKSAADIRIALFYKKAGDTVRLKVRRKRFLLGPVEIDFEVKVQ
jgi:aminopeptidase N